MPADMEVPTPKKKTPKLQHALQSPMLEGWRVVENPDGSFMVQRDRHRAHRVISTGGLECCDCEDFHFRGHTCVHIRVLRAWQDWLLEHSGGS